jgi:branched-chain amino acid transport system substrate-binding protein
MNGDTESSVDVARARAERLIGEGAQLLVGAFDSGQTTAIAQVAEQRGIPLVINIAAAPPITEQGYKFVFRNFPTAPMILGDAFANQLEVFAATGVSPKSVVFMHVNDTFGNAMKKGFGFVMSKFPAIPYKVVETIAYDPAARDLSVEVAKAKATGAEALVMVSRLNDAILITRELVKQRWSRLHVQHRSRTRNGRTGGQLRPPSGCRQMGAIGLHDRRPTRVLHAAGDFHSGILEKMTPRQTPPDWGGEFEGRW